LWLLQTTRNATAGISWRTREKYRTAAVPKLEMVWLVNGFLGPYDVQDNRRENLLRLCLIAALAFQLSETKAFVKQGW
jgi:hypothetical protein